MHGITPQSLAVREKVSSGVCKFTPELSQWGVHGDVTHGHNAAGMFRIVHQCNGFQVLGQLLWFHGPCVGEGLVRGALRKAGGEWPAFLPVLTVCVICGLVHIPAGRSQVHVWCGGLHFNLVVKRKYSLYAMKWCVTINQISYSTRVVKFLVFYTTEDVLKVKQVRHILG